MSKKPKLFNIKRLPQDLARLVCAPLLLLLRPNRLTPEGEKYREKLSGGAILAANHTCMFDPFAVGVTFWYRRVFFFVAEVVMRGKLRSFLLKGVGCIKVERSIADLEAVKKAIKILSQGYPLTVFPQGAITKGDEVSALKSGAVLMALRAGVPIIPMHVCKRAHWYSRLKVVIGKTIYPNDMVTKKIPGTADIEKISEALLEEMNRCANPDKENGK